MTRDTASPQTADERALNRLRAICARSTFKWSIFDQMFDGENVVVRVSDTATGRVSSLIGREEINRWCESRDLMLRREGR